MLYAKKTYFSHQVIFYNVNALKLMYTSSIIVMGILIKL